MPIQVVHCHPLIESYDHALFRTSVQTLEQNGHRVVATDLYRERFDPTITVEEAALAAGFPGQGPAHRRRRRL